MQEPSPTVRSMETTQLLKIAGSGKPHPQRGPGIGWPHRAPLCRANEFMQDPVCPARKDSRRLGRSESETRPDCAVRPRQAGARIGQTFRSWGGPCLGPCLGTSAFADYWPTIVLPIVSVPPAGTSKPSSSSSFTACVPLNHRTNCAAPWGLLPAVMAAA